MDKLTLISAMIKCGANEPYLYKLKDENNNFVEMDKDEVFNILKRGSNIENIKLDGEKIVVDTENIFLIRSSRDKTKSAKDILTNLNILEHWADDIHLLKSTEVGATCKTEIPFRCTCGHVYNTSLLKLSNFKGTNPCPKCNSGKSTLEKIYKEKNAEFALKELERSYSEEEYRDIINNPDKYKGEEFKFTCELGHVTYYTLANRIKYTNRMIRRCVKCGSIQLSLIDTVMAQVIKELLSLKTEELHYDVEVRHSKHRTQRIKFLIPKLQLAIQINSKKTREVHYSREELLNDSGYKLIDIDISNGLMDEYINRDISAYQVITEKLDYAITLLTKKLHELQIDTASINKDTIINKGVENINNDVTLDKIVTISDKILLNGKFIEVDKNKREKEPKKSSDDTNISEKDSDDKGERGINNSSDDTNISEENSEDKGHKAEETKDTPVVKTKPISVTKHDSNLDKTTKGGNKPSEGLDRVGVQIASKDGCKMKPLEELTNTDKFSGVIIGTYEIKAENIPSLLLKLAYFIYMTDFVSFAKIVEDHTFRYEYYDREFRIVSTKHYEIRNVSNISNTCVLVDTTLGTAKNIKYIKRMVAIANLSGNKALLKLKE